MLAKRNILFHACFIAIKKQINNYEKVNHSL